MLWGEFYKIRGDLLKTDEFDFLEKGFSGIGFSSSAQ
jgi:hypothetical protein